MENKKKKLIIIDAMGVIYRAFYAIKHLTNSEGMMTNAVYGFTQIVRKVLADSAPDYVVVAFDSKEKTFRHEIYEDYKSNREEMPEDLTHQIDYVVRMVEALNLKIVKCPGYEADDIMATLCKRFASNELEAVMVTSDKDMYQLVSENVKALDGRAEKYYDTEEDVVEKFGVKPPQILDMLSLAGDASDCIPGVPGVGPKTAVKLLAEFHDLDAIYENIDSMKPSKLKDRLIDNKEQAYLSKRLATLHVDVPFEVTLDEMHYGEPNFEALEPLLKELGFTKLLKEFGGTKQSEEINVSVVDSNEDFKSLIKSISSSKEFAVTLDFDGGLLSGELLGVALAYDENKEIAYVPVGAIRGSEINEDIFVKSFVKLLEDGSLTYYSSDYKNLHRYFLNHGAAIRQVAMDTSIASYLLNPSSNGHSIDELALNELDMNLYFRPPGRKTKEVPLYGDKDAAGKRAFAVYKLSKQYEEKLKSKGLYDLLINLELEVARTLAEMEFTGIEVDKKLLKDLSLLMDRELLTLQQELYDIAGYNFNIASPKQLSELLFEKLGLTPIKKTKTGFSTDESVLSALSSEHEVPAKIIRYRQVAKLKSTYVDSLIELVNAKTGRVHTSFNQTVTATGRLSSSNPNLQNIPVGTGYAEEIRKSFKAKEGCQFVTADYSQIELRIVAHMSKDKILIDSFMKGEDIHSRTASEVFSVKPKEVTSDMRRSAKAINFGIIYGMGAFGLANELGVSIGEAGQYIDKYFARYEGVAQFIDELINVAKTKGYTETLMGRIRSIPELKSPSEQVKRLGQRLAVNTPIQGSAADIMKLAMVNAHVMLKEEGLKSKILLQIHDELLLECPDDEVDLIKVKLKEEMESAFKLTVPLTVNVQTGPNWNISK